MSEQINNKISNSEYETLVADSLKNSSAKEKSITTGKVISIDNDIVTIDVGLKSEGRIPLSEFSRPGHKAEIEVGDETEVFIENVDNANGETLLSRERRLSKNPGITYKQVLIKIKLLQVYLSTELKVV